MIRNLLKGLAYLALAALPLGLLAQGTITPPGTGGGGGGSGTVTHTAGALTANLPVFGNAGNDIKVGTISGNTTQLVSTTGTLTAGNCVKIDAAGNFVDNGATCAGGGGVAGTTADVQFNGGSGFAADTGLFTYNSSTHTLASRLFSGAYFDIRAAKTAAYTLTATDSLVTGDTSGGTFTLTLPTAVGISGRQYTLKKIDSSTTALTVGTTSAQTIDGAATQSLIAQGCVITVESNGANWDVKSGTCPGFADPGADKLVYFNNTTKLLAAATAVPTNTTLVLPIPFTFLAGVCQNATASGGFSTPVSNPATFACVTGTNTQQAVAQFAAASNLSMQGHFPLPSDMTGAIDFSDTWYGSPTTGAVVWQVATACVDAGATGDPSFNTASTVTSTVAGTTNQFVHASITGVTITGCSASKEFYWKISRNAGTGSDTMSGTANLVSFSFIVRRTVTVGS